MLYTNACWPCVQEMPEPPPRHPREGWSLSLWVCSKMLASPCAPEWTIPPVLAPHHIPTLYQTHGWSLWLERGGCITNKCSKRERDMQKVTDSKGTIKWIFMCRFWTMLAIMKSYLSLKPYLWLKSFAMGVSLPHNSHTHFVLVTGPEWHPWRTTHPQPLKQDTLTSSKLGEFLGLFLQSRTGWQQSLHPSRDHLQKQTWFSIW